MSDDKSDKGNASFAFKVTVDNFDSVRDNYLLVDTVVFLEGALFIPSYRQNIFSVQ